MIDAMQQDRRYVFGPVPSRRLGQSLGIDTIPFKTCNWNCVYCQLGRSVPLTNERREYIARDEILAEVEQALARHSPGEIDWITFVGSGEPTLHVGIGWLIERVRRLSGLPIAVITNGSLLYLPEVHEALALADAILPSLDAGTPELFRRVNRPHPHATFAHLIEGLARMREFQRCRLWVEVMLVRGLNDTEEALGSMAGILQQISPDEVHIKSPTRPPAEPWVEPPDEEALRHAREIFGQSGRVVSPAKGALDIDADLDGASALMAALVRHPMSEEELGQVLPAWPLEKLSQALQQLQAAGRARVVQRYGKRFWTSSAAQFPE
jgi:wyosine [tRNA(Phe)-imidazoG37] synthetase (radical SAM superfamily)